MTPFFSFAMQPTRLLLQYFSELNGCSAATHAAALCRRGPDGRGSLAGALQRHLLARSRARHVHSSGAPASVATTADDPTSVSGSDPGQPAANRSSGVCSGGGAEQAQPAHSGAAGSKRAPPAPRPHRRRGRRPRRMRLLPAPHGAPRPRPCWALGRRRRRPPHLPLATAGTGAPLRVPLELEQRSDLLKGLVEAGLEGDHALRILKVSWR